MKSNGKATINDVARLAGVSIKTVSRVVNNEPNVRQDTRVRVQQAIQELRYHPNTAARDLASNKARLIALVYDDQSAYEVPSAGYIIKMQDGALKACRPAGYELLIYPCRYRDAGVGRELKDLIERVRPAGIVLAAPLSNQRSILQAMEETAIPFVRLSPGTQTRNHPSIATNDREFSEEMTRYLGSLGHTRIAFITGDRRHAAVANRLLGYQDGLEKLGLPYREHLVCDGDNSLRSGEICAEKLLSRKNRPTAIFAANDDMAAGVIRVADRRGLTVPKDLSVAGCDDIALASQIYPSLTTINQPLTTMAEQAVHLLVDSAVAPTPVQSSTVPAKLVIRESTGPAPD